MTGPASITALATATPPARSQDELWDGYFARHFAGNRWARRIYASAGPRQRHPAVDPTREDVSTWTTGERMRRYLTAAAPLATAAAGEALALAGVEAADVGLLAVVSCTGYSTPGVDVEVARDLGFSTSTERAVFGHMGCHAALPALGMVTGHVAWRRRPALLVCVEVPSLHVQPPSLDPEQVVAHALFSDAAAAVVVEPGPHRGGLAVMGIEACTDIGAAQHITWEITDMGFRMGLSRHVPDLLARHVGPTVDTLLRRHGLDRAAIAAWAVHPGGPRVLDAVGSSLDLPDAALEPSRDVLAAFGNCSSATVLLVLQELQKGGRIAPGQFAVLLAFGPGLTLYAVLLACGG